MYMQQFRVLKKLTAFTHFMPSVGSRVLTTHMLQCEHLLVSMFLLKLFFVLTWTGISTVFPRIHNFWVSNYSASHLNTCKMLSQCAFNYRQAYDTTKRGKLVWRRYLSPSLLEKSMPQMLLLERIKGQAKRSQTL